MEKEEKESWKREREEMVLAVGGQRLRRFDHNSKHHLLWDNSPFWEKINQTRLKSGTKLFLLVPSYRVTSWCWTSFTKDTNLVKVNLWAPVWTTVSGETGPLMTPKICFLKRQH